MKNPITIPTKKHPVISINIMEEYLDSLKQIVKQYSKTHNIE